MKLIDKIMVHRYAYYVKDDPLISDYEYDILERVYEAESGVVLEVGSSNESNYSQEIKEIYNNRPSELWGRTNDQKI